MRHLFHLFNTQRLFKIPHQNFIQDKTKNIIKNPLNINLFRTKKRAFALKSEFVQLTRD